MAGLQFLATRETNMSLGTVLPIILSGFISHPSEVRRPKIFVHLGHVLQFGRMVTTKLGSIAPATILSSGGLV